MNKSSLVKVIASVAISSCLAACSTTSTPAGRTREKSTAPHAVQASAEYPGWAVFSPIGDVPIESIAPGFSTHVWASQPQSDSILRIAFDGTFDSIRVPTKGANPGPLVAGPRGDMWFVERAAAKIGEIGMPDGPVVEFPLPERTEKPIGIAMSAGRDIWYIDRVDGRIGKMTPSGTVTTYHARRMNGAVAIADGPDGDLWFCGTAGGPDIGWTGIVGTINPSGVIAEYDLAKGEDFEPTGLAEGGDRNMWVAAAGPSYNGLIAKVSPNGSIRVYPVSGPPRAIAAYGPDKLDFTIDDGARFGEIALDGSITYSPLPGGSSARATDVAVSPNGDEWFTGSLDGKSAVFVRLPSKIDVAPASVTLAAPGASQKITVSEKKYSGKWKVQSSDDGIVDVTKGKTLDTFTVVAISDGTCSVTIADKKGNSVTIPVTVK